MTLSNNVKQIYELTGMVEYHCDEREYEQAHCALDDIEAKVHALRRHVDTLQLMNIYAARPAGPGSLGDGET